MKNIITLFFSILAISSYPQKATYTPAPPKYNISGKPILYEGYIINRDGAKAFTEKREYAGFCFDYTARLPVIKVTDSLVMVAFNGHDRLQNEDFFYVSKKSIGRETDIPLDNFDLNERYTDHDWRDEKISFEENCGERETNYQEEESQFDGNAYPDVVVTLISEKEFLNMKKTAVLDYLTIDKTVKKKGKTIIIGGQKFSDSVSEEGEELTNEYTYICDYKELNASLLVYMCSACEEYTYPLIDKRTGKEIVSFTNIPVFSKNYEYVMDLGQLFSSNPTILSCYKWKDRVKPEVPSTYKEFANWSPVGKGFWGKDNCFYTPVVPTITIDNHNAEEKERTAAGYNFRYVKIIIKGPTTKQEE